MSLKKTEEHYKYVIETLIKEITEDPSMGNLSSDVLETLEATWKKKLLETGCYTPSNNPQQMMPQYANIQPAGSAQTPSTQASHIGDNMGAILNRVGGNEQQLWIPPQQMDRQKLGIQPQNVTIASAHLKSDQQAGGQNDQADATSKTASIIDIKQESQPEHSDSKAGGDSQKDGNAAESEQKPKPKMQHASIKPISSGGDPESEKEKQMYEEQKFENPETKKANKADDDDDDEGALFGYHEETKKNIEEENDSKSESDQGNKEGDENDSLNSADDVEHDDNVDIRDILIACEAKVSRHRNKWKVTLFKGIMSVQGKEYILSQVNGDFEF